MVKKELLLKLIKNKKNNQLNVFLPKKEFKKCGEKLDDVKVLKILDWELE